MSLLKMLRSFHLNSYLRATLDKNKLSKLRKKTGYTFTNCKKALEISNNDIILAEKWLNEQAQALGWSKAAKLEGRTTLQGLIGLSLETDAAVIMEVNCETDFVARNKSFKSFVEMSVASCLDSMKKCGNVNNLSKISLDKEQLKAVKGPQGQTLADLCALTISKVGENISLRRAICVKSPRPIHLAGYTHPSPEKLSDKVLTGKYGALLAYTSGTNNDKVQQITRQLCQHIVGMNPTKVGKLGEDKPSENKDEESIMIHQEFLLDPSIRVSQLIDDTGVEIYEFVRFECGEVQTNEEESSFRKTAGILR